MFWLVSRLLPYLLCLAGLLMLVGSLPVIIGGGETAPTTVALADVSTASPKARWLNITGGGLYLPDAVVDEQVKKSDNSRKAKAWYVPLVHETEAMRRAAEMAGLNTTLPATTPASGSLVLVKFNPDEFLRRYPAANKLSSDDVFRAAEVQGVRGSNAIFPARLKDYIRTELKLPLDGVVVVDFEAKPLQRNEATTMAGIGAVLLFGGGVWTVSRFRKRA